MCSLGIKPRNKGFLCDFALSSTCLVMPGSYPWLLMTPPYTGTKRDPIWPPSILTSTYFSAVASLYLRIVLFLFLLSSTEYSGICSWVACSSAAEYLSYGSRYADLGFGSVTENLKKKKRPVLCPFRCLSCNFVFLQTNCVLLRSMDLLYYSSVSVSAGPGSTWQIGIGLAYT